MSRASDMQNPNLKSPRSEQTEHLATLCLRFEALQGAIDDVRSAALVVSNMSRFKKDRTLEQLADGLHGVHGVLHGQFDEAVRALRQYLANDHQDENEVRPIQPTTKHRHPITHLAQRAVG